MQRLPLAMLLLRHAAALQRCTPSLRGIRRGQMQMSTTKKSVTIKRGKARLFRDGNPLVYGGAVERTTGSINRGDAVEVVVDDDEAGIVWKRAEVRHLVRNGRFRVCIDGDEEFIEAYGMADEHKEWRHKDGRQAAAARGPRGELPSVGDEIQAEVNDDDGRTRWRDAEVRRLLEGGRFECCIDGDEDFNEEYGMADEGTEWRLKPPADASVLPSGLTARHVTRASWAAAEGSLARTAGEAAAAAGVRVHSPMGWRPAAMLQARTWPLA